TQEHAAELNDEAFPPPLAGPWAKLRGYAARLALIVHFLRWACNEITNDVADVDGESMRRAARLVAYFKSHARKVYAVMAIDTKMAAARRLLKWLLENRLEEFTRRDAYREMRGTCKTPEEIDPVLATLEQHGFIRPREDPQARRPGRKPSPVYEVNPLDSG